MISYKEFNNWIKWGRFGNQLFQYAFLRTTAQRLGVKFYCPEWMGDEIFALEDKKERAAELINIDKNYLAPQYNSGFDKNAMNIKDGTNIAGFFQTERYFDVEKLKIWYAFRDEKVSRVKEKYRHIDFSKSVGIHLRLGDLKNNPMNRIRYYIPPCRYYKRALSRVEHIENILVFSDEIEDAKKHLNDIKGNIIYMERNRDYEDLYLMSLCHDFICSGSSFSWWGARLNNYTDKTIVAPKEGAFRPNSPIKNNDYWPTDWIKIKALGRI